MRNLALRGAGGRSPSSPRRSRARASSCPSRPWRRWSPSRRRARAAATPRPIAEPERRAAHAAPAGRGRPASTAGARARLRDLLVATLFATAPRPPSWRPTSTSSAPMCSIGNPLTLAIIEFFAVPGRAARHAALSARPRRARSGTGSASASASSCGRPGCIGAAPASTLHLPAFAPWALPCLALARAVRS